MRIRTIIAAAAAPAALAATLLGTTAASAAPNPNPGNGAVVITSQAQANALGAMINKNVVIPAGASINLQGVTITGNMSVEGQLGMSGDVIDGNVSVSGPGSGIGLFNNPSTFERNLTVENSSGYNGGNAYGWSFFDNASQYGGTSQVNGDFTFDNNTGALYVDGGATLTVGGNFTAYSNTQYPSHWDTTGLNVQGSQSIS
jgi:hypothetical protein